LTVEQAMTRDYSTVPALVTLNQIVQERVLRGGQHSFFVTDALGRPLGLLSLQAITRIPQIKWRFTTAEETMTPMSRLESVDPNTDLLDALQKMEEANLSELPVVQQNQPVGMLIRENVLRYLRLRTQLGV